MDSPEILQILGEFSQQIVGGDGGDEEEGIREELEQVDRIIGQLVAADKAGEPQFCENGAGDNAGIIDNDSDFNKQLHFRSQSQSQQSTNGGGTLPLEEPQTLEFNLVQTFNFQQQPSPQPEPEQLVQQSIVAPGAIEAIKKEKDFSKTFFEEADLYDTTWSPGSVDIELFPELY